MEVSRAIELPDPPGVVWPALVAPERLGDWLDAQVEMDPRPGGAGRFDFESGEVREALVHEVEPERRLVFTWWPLEDGRRRTGEATTVTLTIEAHGAGSRVRVAETPVGLPRAGASPSPRPHWEARLRGFATARETGVRS